MLFASLDFLNVAFPIACGIAGGVIGLWIGTKLPVPEWKWRRAQRKAEAEKDDPEMAEIRKRTHEIARRAYPELVR